MFTAFYYAKTVNNLSSGDRPQPATVRPCAAVIQALPGASAVAAGNSDWGLGLHAPELLTALAIAAAIAGAVLLALGLFTRLVSLPLMVTMAVAIFAVHWPNGWLAIADGNSWLANQQVLDAQQQLSAARSLLQEHGNYDWLTQHGSFVILNNGIEFAATYFMILLSLFFTGGGRFTSVDYWLHRAVQPRVNT